MAKTRKTADLFIDPADESGTVFIFLPEFTTREEYEHVKTRVSGVHELESMVLRKEDRWSLALKPRAWIKEITDLVEMQVTDICKAAGTEMGKNSLDKVQIAFADLLHKRRATAAGKVATEYKPVVTI